ncbi:hypothetical protein AC249_AIPGENE6160 [Exaiptasia diaphana]|nr:hypothetical protein AC249_AIPGENE6160 [Exaiptasia diaphana]
MSEVPTTSNNSSSTMCDLNDPEGSLYTDFASSSSPLQFVQPSRVGLLGGDDSETTASIDKSNSKKPNRKDWIDTENPLHCKPCDFTANDVQRQESCGHILSIVKPQDILN